LSSKGHMVRRPMDLQKATSAIAMTRANGVTGNKGTSKNNYNIINLYKIPTFQNYILYISALWKQYDR
jgi:hypothetical protein